MPGLEGGQEDAMWSPPPVAPPSRCAPPAKQRASLHTAPLSLLPMVRPRSLTQTLCCDFAAHA